MPLLSKWRISSNQLSPVKETELRLQKETEEVKLSLTKEIEEVRKETQLIAAT